MEVKDTKKRKWNVITLICMAAIIAGVTTTVSFAAAGNDPAVTASDTSGGYPVKSGNAKIAQKMSNGKYRYILYENGTGVYSSDGGKTWKKDTEKTVRITKKAAGKKAANAKKKAAERKKAADAKKKSAERKKAADAKKKAAERKKAADAKKKAAERKKAADAKKKAAERKKAADAKKKAAERKKMAKKSTADVFQGKNGAPVIGRYVGKDTKVSFDGGKTWQKIADPVKTIRLSA
ncbi:MAG: hypothetical protein LBO70_00205 [Clostridiales Family XIII bacterium]|jgi:flagellar biosynthesis GTPase FlhF|nr:hypothetical protein [Clostridiales Family XIII bacterium]